MINSISSVKTVQPKEFPLYATEFPRAVGPSIKFQKRQNAKLSLRHQMRDGYHNYGIDRSNELDEITLYKYNDDTKLYESIFDSKSDLAEAYRQDHLTGDELLAMIDW